MIKQKKFNDAMDNLLYLLDREDNKPDFDRNLRFLQTIRYFMGAIYDIKGDREKAIKEYMQTDKDWGPKYKYAGLAEKAIKKPVRIEDIL